MLEVFVHDSAGKPQFVLKGGDHCEKNLYSLVAAPDMWGGGLYPYCWMLAIVFVFWVVRSVN